MKSIIYVLLLFSMSHALRCQMGAIGAIRLNFKP